MVLIAHYSCFAFFSDRLRVWCIWVVCHADIKHTLVFVSGTAIDSFSKRAATFVSGSLSSYGTLWVSVENVALTLLLTDSSRLEAWSLYCIFVLKTCIWFHRAISDNSWSLLYRQLILSTRSLFFLFIFLNLFNCLSVQRWESDYITVIISRLIFDSRTSNCESIASIIPTISLQSKSALAAS